MRVCQCKSTNTSLPTTASSSTAESTKLMSHNPVCWRSQSYVLMVWAAAQLASSTSTEVQCDSWHFPFPAPMEPRSLLLWHHNQGPDWSPDGCPDWILAQTAPTESLAQCYSGCWSSPPALPNKHAHTHTTRTLAHEQRYKRTTSMGDIQLKMSIHKNKSLNCQQLYLAPFNLSLPFICLVNWF